ncbi:hypothetical protein [Micromonospora sp. NPDC092111]|uniref:hypothetical protein n=1 Tax=Micromonospora sp. NPDC092111 TaxID=3364289 RepID=UPI0037F60DCA
MTTAPANLLAVRRLLLDTIKALDPASVGIVGDPAHRGGYHTGADRVVANDYSVVESRRDSAGLTLHASALDVGVFSVRSGGATHNLRTFSAWCVAQCRADSADSRDLREIIYSPDGKTVRRWDRLGRRSTGDNSHLYHTHFSFFRDSTKAGRDQTPLFRRYLTSIGLLEDRDMTPEEHAWLKTVHKNLTVLDGRNPVGQIYTRMAMGEDDATPGYVVPHPTLKSLGAQLTALQSTLAVLADAGLADEQAVVASVLAELTPEKIAAAIPPTVAKQVADELAKRLVA